jgi:hypothetical protein
MNKNYILFTAYVFPMYRVEEIDLSEFNNQIYIYKLPKKFTSINMFHAHLSHIYMTFILIYI